ncbi:MAG TPA: DNA mismatch repair endonuclease MutL [Candidatus Eisenbacteria bacterium]|nr:DNA mismatch repair endonuclease MutL [Candidatus Eisenbacteria bacterium]
MPDTATPVIRRLTPETASRIAAGEVIERPLSALKELIENALDAGARAIEVRVERALDHRFVVSDDGAGIAADELALALERHCTSKIGGLEDLDRLVTLGFRGEALPSIAAVSRMRITTRTAGGDAAATLRAEGGAVVEQGVAARAPGTTVEVAELFFNTPARRKFLGTPSGELRAALRMLEAYALGWPEVGFRLVVDERERFDWPAAGSRRDRAAAIWGPRHAAQLLDANGERDGIAVEALLGLPEHARATREGQVLLVNRRWVQSPVLGAALRQAYGNLIPPGRFPAATLWIAVPPARLDVNVHPTKREVRFADEDTLFSLVGATCARPLSALQPPFTVVPGGGAEPKWADRVRERPQDQTALLLDVASPPAGASAPAATSAEAQAAEPDLWQLHRTYVLAAVRGGLVIVDQHAAHERILFEEAMHRFVGREGPSQLLLFPVVVDLARDRYELLLEVGPWLAQLGWNLRPLGPPTVVIQGVPSGLTHERPGQLLQDMLDGLHEETARDARGELAEALARSYACHAAIKAGDPLTRAEMQTLIDRLFATSRPHGDPHGRVTFVRLDLDELHRRFGRA